MAEKLGRVKEVPSPRVNATWTTRPGDSGEIVLFGGEHFDGKQCQFYNDLFMYYKGML